MIAVGARFQWPPRVTLDHTLWEIVAYIDGHNRANADPSKPEAMSDAEFDAMLQHHKIG